MSVKEIMDEIKKLDNKQMNELFLEFQKYEQEIIEETEKLFKIVFKNPKNN